MATRLAVRVSLVCVAVMTAPAARAEPARPSPSATPKAPCGATEQHLPGQVRCVAQLDGGADPLWLWPPRLLLAPVRLAFRTVSELVLAVVGLEDRYHLSTRAVDLFWNDARTFGVYPSLGYETGIGLGVGVHLVHKDLFGHGEGLRLTAAFASLDRQIYEARVDSGRYWEALELSMLLGYSSLDDLRFYGVGNADRVAASAAATPIDALQPNAAVRGFYREQQVKAQLGARLQLARRFWLEAAPRVRVRRISAGDRGSSGGPWVDELYAPASLVGFGETLANADIRLAAIWDAMRGHRPDLPRDLPSQGTRVEAWGGVQVELEGKHAPIGRLGLDLLQRFDLYRGNRVLGVRLRGETVLGALDEIPFFDLAELGGTQLLRGYNPQRFSGRLSLLSSLEYRYPVTEAVAGYLFVDAGRVYASLDELSLSSLERARVGFGFGLQFYNPHGALFRLQLASSIDGGLFFALSFGAN